MAHRPFSLRPGALASRLLLVVTIVLAASAGAQGVAEAAGDEARAALAGALLSGQDPHPDQPAWREAYEAADEAVERARADGAPGLTRALRLSAHVYAHIGWHSRAFAAFDQFLAEGGELSREPFVTPVADATLPSDMQAFVDSVNQLAYARYEAGDMGGAVAYYLTVLDLDPAEPEALRWLGRIGFERGDEAGARTAMNAFGRLLEQDPSDASARYFLALSQERLEIGTAASDAYRAGIAHYERGELEPALERFEEAVAAAPGHVDSAVWAGRTALELRRPQLAVSYWQRVIDARPDDQGAAWFLGLARAQVRWGVAAAQAYYDGLASYETGDLDSAAANFVAATEANAEYVDAWVWAARSLQEQGEPLASIPYWERVLKLDPGDERAAWYLRRARSAIDDGEVAGPAYFDAVAAYQVGDAQGALALLETALAEEPGFALAWGLKGRIAFQLERYEAAAEAYARAAELEPDNDDYAFFAEEARMLSAEEGSEAR